MLTGGIAIASGRIFIGREKTPSQERIDSSIIAPSEQT
jgi:hypothetical protein